MGVMITSLSPVESGGMLLMEWQTIFAGSSVVTYE